MHLWNKYGLPHPSGSPPMAMDYAHVERLYDSVMGCRPRLAVEIGSYQGHSTVAFLEAMNDIPDLELHVFDIAPTPQLRALVADRPRVYLHPVSVWGSDLRPDYVFIDGDHGVPALADLGWALARGASTIAMHDTNSHTAGLTPEGSELAAGLLRDMPDRVWTEDKEPRAGQWTHRGFGESTIR